MSTESQAAAPVVRAHEIEAQRDLERFLIPAGVLAAVGAVVLIAAITSDTFLTIDNALAIMRTASITGIVAVLATPITLSGNFFSIALGQTAVFAAVIFGIVSREGGGFAGALLVTLLAVIVVGAIQGGVVALGASPIVTALGAAALLAGISGIMTGAGYVQMPTNSVTDWLGSGRSLGVPSQAWVFLIAIIVMSIVVRRLRLGRATLLSGANKAAAAASGIGVARVAIAAFVLASIGAGIAGIFQATQFNLVRLDMFVTLDFDVIAAILVGGTAVSGGDGSPLRSAFGALFIAVIGDYMLLRGWSEGTRTGVLGLVVIAAVLTFHLLRSRSRMMT